jgi:hypothetical protein
MGVERGRNMGMPVDEFVEKAWAQLVEGSDHVIVGPLPPADKYLELVKGRREIFENLSNVMAAHFQL